MTTANSHAAAASTTKVDPETVTISGYVVGERYGPETVLTHDLADHVVQQLGPQQARLKVAVPHEVVGGVGA